MKIINKNSDLGMRLAGTDVVAEDVVQVDVLHKEEWIEPRRVRQYYKVDSGPIYESALRPCKYDRFVFLEPGTSNYTIIPDNGTFTFHTE